MEANETRFEKECPSCGKTQTYSSKKALARAERLNRRCLSCSKTKLRQLERECPSCGKTQTYAQRSSWLRAEKLNRKCLSCSMRIPDEPLERECPKCKKVFLYSTRGALHKSIRNDAVCRHCRIFSEEHRKKLSIAMGGDGDIERLNSDNPSGRSSRNRARTDKLRKECYERDNYACRICGDKSGGNLNAHHILPWAKHKEFRYELWNLVTLCVSCHKEEHKRMRKAKKEQERFESTE